MKLRRLLPTLCLVPMLAHAQQPDPQPSHHVTVSALVVTAMAKNLATALDRNAALEREVDELRHAAEARPKRDVR